MFTVTFLTVMILCVTGVTVLPENQMEDGASATAAGEGREAPSVVGLLVGAILRFPPLGADRGL